MVIISGKLLVPSSDYNKSVSAVDVNLNGSQIGVVYVESGNLKAGSVSCVQNWDGTLPAAMSGCNIIS